jgi:hypothetical protein
LQRKYYSESWHIMYIDEEWEDVDDYRTDYEIISKDYGFIKRLVDNDKINFNLLVRVWSWEFIYDMTGNPYYNSCTCEDLEEYGDVDRVLMLLAISDSPIDDLISYLN